jgi:hypothetical protein
MLISEVKRTKQVERSGVGDKPAGGDGGSGRWEAIVAKVTFKE